MDNLELFIEELLKRAERESKKMSEAKSVEPYSKYAPASHRYYKAISVKKLNFLAKELAKEFKEKEQNIDRFERD